MTATAEGVRARPERLPVGMLLAVVGGRLDAYAVVVAFAAGAALGAVATRAIGIRAVWLGAALLAVVLAAIVAETHSVERATP